LFLFVFLPVVLSTYLLLRGIKLWNFWLLLASVVFYAWGEFSFVILLLLSVMVNYIVAVILERQTTLSGRKRLLALGVAGNLGLLGLFKYANAVITVALHLLGANPVVTFDFFPLPLGISFFTFHALSYLIDVYRQKQRAATNPGELALYIFFFPQLIAGPILRWQAMAPQFLSRQHTLEKFTEGIRRFVFGLAKKVLIANTVAFPADQIFSLPASQLSTADAWLGAVCYMLQIYFDFSGYSDMALGMGKMFGFEFIENFDFPYISQSIREFWRRWHISLSTWFRDYLYFPLGGNRAGAARTGINLVIVFFLCGLWHGAGWTFVVWGLYHGLFLVLERSDFGPWLAQMPRWLRHGYALLVVMTGWVFFRAEDFPAAVNYLSAMAGLGHAIEPQPCWRYATHLVLWAILTGIVFSVPWWERAKAKIAEIAAGQPVFQRSFLVAETLGVLITFYFSLAWMAGETYNPFIYYRF
jgi:alginate O-acetyltransferase complex protein AlgI